MGLDKLLGLPLNASTHGAEIDNMIGLLHWLMLLLFVGWGVFFIYTLFRFRSSKNPNANYQGVKSHVSTYTEAGIVVIEAVLLLGFAIPIWADVMTDHPESGAEGVVEVRVVAQQFAWNIHYPGADGVFGKTDVNLLDEEINPLGLDREDPAAADDITTINTLNVPVDTKVLVQLSSKDVIHSFRLTEMRVMQDAIPGLVIPVSFEATQTGNWEIACAQLCGLGHYRMRGFFNVQSQADFQAWLDQKASELGDPGEEEW